MSPRAQGQPRKHRKTPFSLKEKVPLDAVAILKYFVVKHAISSLLQKGKPAPPPTSHSNVKAQPPHNDKGVGWVLLLSPELHPT